jgi:hypothetical protein
MRQLLLALAFCLPAFATRIEDADIRDAGGRRITSGTIMVCPPVPFPSGLWWIAKDCVNVGIVNGRVSTSLVPGTYSVHWKTTAEWNETWVVVDSQTPLTIKEVVSVNGYVPVTPLTFNTVPGIQFDPTKLQEPACEEKTRGYVRVYYAPTGHRDIARICLKNLDDIYSWMAVAQAANGWDQLTNATWDDLKAVTWDQLK